jgi:hypothetical protein
LKPFAFAALACPLDPDLRPDQESAPLSPGSIP